MFKHFIACSIAVLSGSAFAVDVGGTVQPVTLWNYSPTTDQMYQGNIFAPLAGKQFVILNVSQINCGACREFEPAFKQLANQTQNVATSREIIRDRNGQAIDQHIRSIMSGATQDFAYDVDRSAGNALGTRVTPTIFVLDASGKVLFRQEGSLDQRGLARVKQMVGAQ